MMSIKELEKQLSWVKTRELPREYKYSGELSDNKKEGFGIVTTSQNVWKCSFKNDVVQEGIMYYTDDITHKVYFTANTIVHVCGKYMRLYDAKNNKMLAFNDNNIWLYSSYDQLFMTVINNQLEIHNNISVKVILDNTEYVNSTQFTKLYASFNNTFNKMTITNLCVELLCADYSHTNQDIETVKNQCCICLCKQATHIYITCLHVCVCDSCHGKLNTRNCPICKTYGTAKKIFYS